MFPKDIFYDLRRMNHIIEINEKNMYAVVEPYVITAELQAELMKRGLTLCIKEPGATARRCSGATDIWTRPPAVMTATIWRLSG